MADYKQLEKWLKVDVEWNYLDKKNLVACILDLHDSVTTLIKAFPNEYQNSALIRIAEQLLND